VYRHPTDHVSFMGVTGTNGKTSVVHFLEAIAEAAGRSSGVIGTIETRWRGKRFATKNTTPGADELHRLVREMVDDGVDLVASEISSHAIDMHRVSSVHFGGLALTNVKSDHLDYHKTHDHYRETKRRLFYKKGADAESVTVDHVVVNVDDETGRHIIATTDLPVLSFGFHDEAELQGTILRTDRAGIHMHTTWEGEDEMISLPMIGSFNASNALAATGLALTQGITLKEAAAGLAELEPVPGRLQRVEAGQPFLVLLDYAHSANAIITVLAAAREVTEGDVIFVFGCGGDRDQGKRMDMGCAAGRGADFCVLTDDNPRHEDPSAIRAEAERGLIQTKARYENIGDRREAIRTALAHAKPNDVVVIAGKGHEEVQIIGDEHVPFSDRAVVTEILEDA
ncbi:MAG: UDP-N-acetylmuramoyl-L-alanyl-D-glutamate--2,6-diaminopimelate ligase, partial [Gemmatimonadetes bacterium]|nr:UDP-N-acetylmuramoyl-L-alanyl-D-glutamate--2,6-diaminopimelate ligase [Gemmatimonadota bacterium]